MSKRTTDADWILEIFNCEPLNKTLDMLVSGVASETSTHFYNATNMPASRVRRALGKLYGLGLIKVVDVVDGKVVWAKTSTEDKLAL